jgi:hypothetical protein
MAGPGDLFAAAEELLVAAAEALDTIPDLLGTSFAGAPDRQYISPGNVVHDCCEQLAVWVNPVGEGARSPGTLAPGFQITRPTLRVHATRCVPTGTIVGKRYVPPTTTALSAAAEQIHADGWAMWNHFFNLLNAQPEALLFSKCADLVNWGMTALTPSGGCAGWELFFTIGLDGYREELTT